MELTILGSGSGIPSLERGTPGHLIKIGNEPLLFDSGSGTLQRLLKTGTDYRDLNHVFYTHHHSDHTAELVPLIQALRVTPGYHRKKTLHLYGPVGFGDFVERLALAYGSWVLTPGFPIEIHQLERDQLGSRNWTVKTAPVRHSVPAIAYRIESHGRTIVYSGDTDYCDEIIELAAGSDVLILECSFPDRKKVPGHLTPSEAGQIAAQAGCGQLILVHLYPPYEEVETDIQSKCHDFFHGKILIARDNLNVTIE